MNEAGAMQRRWLYIGLAVILATGAWLRWAVVANKQIFTHDETISYLAATGHQGEYAQMVLAKTPPYATWAPRHAWMRFMETEERFCWSTIQNDLVKWDLHPPLYFWLLHIFCMIFGTHLYTGAILNTLLAVTTSLLIWHLGRTIFKQEAAALAAAAIWFLSPALITTSLEARPYDLLALCSAAFAAATIHMFRQPSRVAARLGVLAIVVIGSLSHHHFLLIASGALVFSLMHMRSHKSPLVFFTLTALVSAGYLFATVFGLDLKHAWLASREQVPPLALAHLGTRLEAMFLALSGFFTQIKILKYLAAAALIALFIIRRRNQSPTHQTDEAMRFVRIMALWTFGWTLALFWFGLSPAHAMGEKYLAIAWPFLSLLLIHLGLDWRPSQKLVWVVFLVMISSSVVRILQTAPDIPASVKSAPSVVIDTAARGELLRLAWHVPGTATVYAAAQSDLLAQSHWRTNVEPHTLFISRLAQGNSKNQQRQILAQWPQGCSLQHQPSPFDKMGAAVWRCAPAQP